MQVLADRPNEPEFLRVSGDGKQLERVVDGEPSAVELAQPTGDYDGSTLRQQRRPDGTIFFTLQIDPVNPAAAARRRAEVAWLDLYRLSPGSGRAVRKARVRLDGRGEELSWQATESTWAIVPRHVGLARGGKQVRIYRLD
jgi:hypothetical protein